MQRWIVWGVVAMMLLCGGGVFAYWTIKQNRPYPVWVPLPINPELTLERRNEIAKDLKGRLLKMEVLLQISRDLRLPVKMHQPSDDAAAQEVGSRLFVNVGEADGQFGKIPSINIGVYGKRKEKDVSGEIAVRLMEDVRKMVGIKPPPPKISPPF